MKLQYDETVSNSAFKFNLRRYIEEHKNLQMKGGRVAWINYQALQVALVRCRETCPAPAVRQRLAELPDASTHSGSQTAYQPYLDSLLGIVREAAAAAGKSLAEDPDDAMAVDDDDDDDDEVAGAGGAPAAEPFGVAALLDALRPDPAVPPLVRSPPNPPLALPRTLFISVQLESSIPVSKAPGDSA